MVVSRCAICVLLLYIQVICPVVLDRYGWSCFSGGLLAPYNSSAGTHGQLFCRNVAWVIGAVGEEKDGEQVFGG